MPLPVVISAAGRGTRMGTLAQARSKHLIEVNGRPFLAYLIDALLGAGASELYLVVGYQAPQAYAFAERYGSRLTVVNQFERLGEERYGTLMPVVAVTPELVGRACSVVMGDNLYSSRDLGRFLRGSGSGLAVVRHEHPERYGVVETQTDGTLARLAEKPAAPSANLINTGLYRFSPGVWPIVPEVRRSSRGEYELTDAVSLLATREPVIVTELADYWLDLGRPEDIPQVAAAIRAAAPQS